jgi:hypothetical protein
MRIFKYSLSSEDRIKRTSGSYENVVDPYDPLTDERVLQIQISERKNIGCFSKDQHVSMRYFHNNGEHYMVILPYNSPGMM